MCKVIAKEEKSAWGVNFGISQEGGGNGFWTDIQTSVCPAKNPSWQNDPDYGTGPLLFIHVRWGPTARLAILRRIYDNNY